MHASIVHGQQQTFLRLWRSLRPYVPTDRALPTRIQAVLRRRAFGARDRRLYRELLYTAIRYLPWIDELAAASEAGALRAVAWLAADDPATREFRGALVADWPPLPPTIAARARHLGVARDPMPAWFRRHCPKVFRSPDFEVMQTRPPIWIRLQTSDPDAVFAEFSDRGWAWRRSDVLPAACEVLTDADLTVTAAYRRGRFEVQDLGSQLVLASAVIDRGGRWLDACAGAGGKTLQLAGLLGPGGGVDAFDVRRAALEELARRARRGGFATIRLLDRLPAVGDYDGVLVDAPCSGSGTWRRAPHLKWSTNETDVAAHARRQRELLARFSRQVRPGGRLVYATCSLSREENQEVACAFLAAHPAFAPLPPARTFGGMAGDPGLTILPACHNTDGFYVAAFRRAR